MAEMTQDMYGATGKVGNKVYYRANGKTVSRELVTPKNPKTDLQTIQRVIASQVGKSYQKFKDVCDHSFEGVTNGMQCMNRFRKLNMRYCRERAAEIQQSGNSLSQFYNFQPIGTDKWVPNATILAQGQLPKVEVLIGQNTGGDYVGSVNIEGNTYGDVIRALGLKRGDQLTFIGVSKFNGDYVVSKARIILDPRDQDGSGASLDSAFISEGIVNLPNWKNSGSFEFLKVSGSALEFKVGRGTQVAASVIVSRKSTSGEWLRSNANLIISEEAIGSDLQSLYGAMEASYQGGDIDLESENYLNNAGVGGGQGSEGQGTGGSTGDTPGGTTGGNTGDTPGGTTGGGDDNTGGGGADPDDPENSED